MRGYSDGQMFGERIWGNDRRYMRAGLVNGGLRYMGTGQGASGNTGKLIEILAPVFREIRERTFRPKVVSA